MSDIDEDLLALAGADEEEEDDEQLLTTSGKRAKNHDQVGSKRKKIEVDSEAEEEEEDDYNPYGGNQSEEEEIDEPNPFPLENKYKDEDDREHLESLPEMERETLLFERSQVMRKYQERKLFRERQRNIKEQQERNELEEEGKKTRSSTRATHATGHSDLKASKLSQLKKQRERKTRDQDYNDVEDEDDLDDYAPDDNYKHEDSEYEEEGEEDEEDYNPYATRKSYDMDKDEVEWAEEQTDREAELDDFNKVKVGRSFIAKYCFYPGFSDLLKGCYGRVNVGTDRRTGISSYRMVKIEKVFLKGPYRMGDFFTNQYLGVTQGHDRKVLQMNIFSDGLFTSAEFDRYTRALENSHLTKPSIHVLRGKSKEIQAFVSEPLTAKMTDAIVRNRMMFNKKLSGTNAVLEKTVLKDKLRYARENNNERDVAKYSSQLRNLEKRMSVYEKHHENDQLGMNKLGALTSKNRKVNMDKIRNAEHIKKEDHGLDSKSDPFSRLKTRTKIYYQEVQKEENEKAQAMAEAKQKQLQENKALNEHKEKELLLARFKRLGGLENLIQNLDINVTFDI
ncbi:RNA polymerase-associated protein NDAI_0I03240 [Naumovozyma dairenensis CBS 421]|uniref:Plus3 domain-containing protein n=1 Tax=Naumovozyma dairenensis (strain ATCC 10597 / BCRC 20456 / CBS 421 / NBRC 0211 / NRRL Y-12639) TaxID=1071378 RepID=G0WGI1_NAUDC|nr:hypothetical protein NDAI_0I03240 [Naumovozyma dairenensis CBS 421]CCD26892.1 hypothetical protein NDAI_0I03240 [Naumovozyma dairenensis CBS 421]